MDGPEVLAAAAVKQSSAQYLATAVDSQAAAGSYQVTVMALARQQKDVSPGYADKSAALFGTGSISLTVGGLSHELAIGAQDNSLEGIARVINAADLGVGATLIHDGTASPWRLVLTGNEVAETFALDSSALTGGTAEPLQMSTTQAAQRAQLNIDGITVYGDSNRIDGAIPGLSIELLSADPNAVTMVQVAADRDASTAKIRDFVTAYNDIVTFIAQQRDSSWGNDAVFRSVKGGLQSLLVQSQGTGAYSSLAQLGFATQRDGQISLDEATLSRAMAEDYEAVTRLFAGAAAGGGISSRFAAYLGQVTDATTGFYAGRQEGTASSIRRIDQQISSLEVRLEQREKTLRAQFSAMENLVSGLNSQGSYLLQQLSSISTTNGR
jgi:flagellar hook-associated protein 2